MVPFSIFISLSANDMVLPTIGGPDGAGDSGEEGVKRYQIYVGELVWDPVRVRESSEEGDNYKD